MQPSEDSSKAFSIKESKRKESKTTKQATDTDRITRTLAEELEWWSWELELERFDQRWRTNRRATGQGSVQRTECSSWTAASNWYWENHQFARRRTGVVALVAQTWALREALGELLEEQLGKAQYKELNVVLGLLLRMQPSKDSSEVSSIKASKRKEGGATQHATDTGRISRTLAKELEWWP
jgi:hypothetical protein